MRPFVFSCDAHIAEPPDLFTRALPEHLKRFAIHTEVEGNVRKTMIGDTVLMKMFTDFHAHKTGYDHHDPARASATQAWLSETEVDTRRRGARDLALRALDMDRDGVDAELVFPSLGLMIHRIPDREGQRVTCEIYNDWAWGYTRELADRLIPAAMLPEDIDDAIGEARRCVEKGYAAVCVAEGLNNYNGPHWDPLFKLCGDNDVPIVFHTGIGHINIRALKGPGGAVFNYTRQMNDAVDIITQLVAGGVLDRNPRAHILFAEHSAGWLLSLAERMNEAYFGHAPMVSPKLSRLPSQIVKDQVHSALQNDTGALLTRKGIGIDALLFATDYPHSEGTFPFSKNVIDKMMADFPDVSREEFIALLGGNAARLFKRAKLQPRVEARARELLAA